MQQLQLLHLWASLIQPLPLDAGPHHNSFAVTVSAPSCVNFDATVACWVLKCPPPPRPTVVCIRDLCKAAVVVGPRSTKSSHGSAVKCRAEHTTPAQPPPGGPRALVFGAGLSTCAGRARSEHDNSGGSKAMHLQSHPLRRCQRNFPVAWGSLFPLPHPRLSDAPLLGQACDKASPEGARAPRHTRRLARRRVERVGPAPLQSSAGGVEVALGPGSSVRG